MWSNPKPDVALECVSTNDQVIRSNVVPPYTSFLPLVITQRGDSGADGKIPNGWPEYITSV